MIFMEEYTLINILKDRNFVSQLVHCKSENDFKKLFQKYNINADKKEILVLQNIVKSVKNDILNKYKKMKTYELDVIAGGKSSSVRYAFAPIYYTAYGVGYGLGKCPIIGYTVYHSIKDAIKGFYESLYNY